MSDFNPGLHLWLSWCYQILPCIKLSSLTFEENIPVHYRRMSCPWTPNSLLTILNQRGLEIVTGTAQQSVNYKKKKRQIDMEHRLKYVLSWISPKSSPHLPCNEGMIDAERWEEWHRPCWLKWSNHSILLCWKGNRDITAKHFYLSNVSKQHSQCILPRQTPSDQTHCHFLTQLCLSLIGCFFFFFFCGGLPRCEHNDTIVHSGIRKLKLYRTYWVHCY